VSESDRYILMLYVTYYGALLLIGLVVGALSALGIRL